MARSETSPNQGENEFFVPIKRVLQVQWGKESED